MAEVLKGLAKETKARGWWHSYGDVIPTWFDVFVALESAAEEVCTYHSGLMPGLFQTADYARVVFGSNTQANTEERERLLLVRMRRQSLLTRPTDPMRYDAILSEAVLRRPVGDRRAMAAQCRRIAELSELPNVRVRVAPFAAGWHLGCDSGPFSILRFPTAANGRELEPTTVYVEGCTGSLSKHGG